MVNQKSRSLRSTKKSKSSPFLPFSCSIFQAAVAQT
jgi:hypothetical protein